MAIPRTSIPNGSPVSRFVIHRYVVVFALAHTLLTFDVHVVQIHGECELGPREWLVAYCALWPFDTDFFIILHRGRGLLL
jgi:hypothetical protein